MSTTFTVTPGRGWPIFPRFAATCRNPGARKSRPFTVTTGEHYGAAITLQGTNAERIFEGLSKALRKLLGAHQNILQ